MKSEKIWEKYWSNFIELTDKEQQIVFNENPYHAFMPFGINDRQLDVEKNKAPIIVITLPRVRKKPDTFILIGKFCRTFVNGIGERFEKLHHFDYLEKILEHHENTLEVLNKDCQCLQPSKYFMSIIYKSKHYVIPLIYKNFNEKQKELCYSATNTAKVIFNDLLNWVHVCKDEFDLNDVEIPFEEYKKENGISTDIDF